MATRKAPAATATPATPAAATALTPPQIGQHWPEQGGTYVGIASDLKGGVTGYLVLLPDAPAARLGWTAAKKWAQAFGNDARLPTRAEALLLFANVKSQLKPNWHWTSEEDDASSAWRCSFYDGSQTGTRKSYEGSAVAVRRLPLQSFSPLDAGAA